ncbi:MAG: hypothetical protein R2761_30255 [Acidimicrobiales bacterium]
MNKKWVYPALLTFLVFFVLSNPETAGPQTRSFFGWMGEQVDAVGTFLDGVFDDDPSSGPATGGGGTGTTTPPGGTPADGFSTLQVLVPQPAARPV